MQSLRELYNVGRGPSSSHTIAPERAAKLFAQRHPNADGFQVVLYGSLAKTAGATAPTAFLPKRCPGKTEIVFDEQTETPHPNTMGLLRVPRRRAAGSAARIQRRRRRNPD